MRTLHTHQARATSLFGKVRTYTPSTYTIAWPDGTHGKLLKSGWGWRFRLPDGTSTVAEYRNQVFAFDAIANLGGTIMRD